MRRPSLPSGGHTSRVELKVEFDVQIGEKSTCETPLSADFRAFSAARAGFRTSYSTFSPRARTVKPWNRLKLSPDDLAL